jgi:hypothetical protein
MVHGQHAVYPTKVNNANRLSVRDFVLGVTTRRHRNRCCYFTMCRPRDMVSALETLGQAILES